MQGSTSSNPAAAPAWRPSAALLQTTAVLSAGLALRLLVLRSVLSHYPAGWLYTRGMEMGLLAKSILAGQGLSSPFGVPTGPTAFIAPAYPLLIAGVFRIFGIDSTASAIFIMAAQVALNLLTLWLILHVARALSGQRAAWIAGLLWACSPPLLWMPTIFWDTCLSTCIMAGLLALALRLRHRFTANAAILAGAGCGLAALFNPALLLVLIAVMAWLASEGSLPHRLKINRMALAACAFLVVFSPWPIRNALAFHAFIPLRTTVGFELWMGNREGATGFLDESLFPMFNPAELARYQAMGEVGYTAGKSTLAKDFIRRHPLTFLELTALRVKRFWTGTGSRGGSILFAGHACITSTFGLAGLWLLFRRRGVRLALLFALPLLLFPIPYYITHAEFRYRLVVDPLLAILSGYALSAAFAQPSRLRLERSSRHAEDPSLQPRVPVG